MVGLLLLLHSKQIRCFSWKVLRFAEQAYLTLTRCPHSVYSNIITLNGFFVLCCVHSLSWIH